MVRLFIYRILIDSGAAPHVSDGYLTLTICKPAIRKSAKNGDYILALVAKTSESMKTLKKTVADKDRSFLAAYLFRVGDVVPLERYDEWCNEHAPHKLCTDEYFEGNAQYDKDLKWRPGPHGPEQRNRNLSGCNSLTSNHFVAWTSRSPHRLTVEELAGLGLTEDEVAKIGIGHKIVKLPDTDMVEMLINGSNNSRKNKTKNKPNGSKNKPNGSSKNKTLKKNKNDKPNGSGRPSGKEGYTLF